jgi:hypothetical protein
VEKMKIEDDEKKILGILGTPERQKKERSQQFCCNQRTGPRQ